MDTFNAVVTTGIYCRRGCPAQLAHATTDPETVADQWRPWRALAAMHLWLTAANAALPSVP